ncbi:hypothetical protein GGR50DRAFT_700692 [Xylaria sp. CBS 124048]|nr:hypothetical protein GGR50DRAFT_700692 [Xylaria sp. CBS 124048]
MPKWDRTRNYYADLELPSTASLEEIKKQFKKLALKYHPDRNPGRETEVNPKFQVIQSAHEILTDATQKRQYDESRQLYTTRYTSSGVKGNPWQDAAKAYDPPPRRQPNPATRPTSGAQRYESFTASMPRTTRPRAQADDTQFRRNNADAWANLRPNSTRKNAQPPPSPTPGKTAPGRAPTFATRDTKPGPIPVPPQTAYQKKKADAAFGTTKKTGFAPRAQGADEPPVTNKNYFTDRTHSYLFTEPDDVPETSSSSRATPAAAGNTFEQYFATATNLSGQPKESPIPDNRQRTPYHTPGGEKTSLFDSNPGLGRSTSTRMPPRNEMPGMFPRTTVHSASPTSTSSTGCSSEDSANAGAGLNGMPSSSSKSAQPKANESVKINLRTTANIPPQPTKGTHVYAPHVPPIQNPSQFTTSRYAMPSEHTAPRRDPSSHTTGYRLRCPSSEDPARHNFCNLLPLEEYQRMTINCLVNNLATAAKNGNGYGNRAANTQHTSSPIAADNGKFDANDYASSFNFNLGSNAGHNGTDYKTFMRNSTENINTRFVDDELLDDWEFKAGSASANEATTPPKTRPQSRARSSRRQTPLTKPTFSTQVPEAPQAPGMANTSNSTFAWNERIGPEHFEPQPMNNASGSPTRRANNRKPKPVKMTAGTAAVVDDTESDEPQETRRSPPAAVPIVPDAMDIDSPAPPKTEEIPKPVNGNRARKYSIEPHREDWRAGDVNGVGSKTAGPTTSDNSTKDSMPSANASAGRPTTDATKPFPSRSGGSEDSEEFLAGFSDFKKVEPIADPLPSGLRSFEDLKFSLPFESQPSEQIPADMRRSVKLLDVPVPPVAPRLPPAMGVAGLRPSSASFRKYAQDFKNYMSKWETFNNRVITHLATRRDAFKIRSLQNGNWLENGAPDYLLELDQDLDVQKKYADACLEHRKRVAEYLDFQDRVK